MHHLTCAHGKVVIDGSNKNPEIRSQISRPDCLSISSTAKSIFIMFWLPLELITNNIPGPQDFCSGASQW